MSTLNIQKSIRDNAEELNDYVRDLNSWLKDMKEQDTKLLQKRNGIAHEQVCVFHFLALI